MHVSLYDSMGYGTGSIEPMGNETQAVYNAAKQEVADVDPLGYRTSYGYDQYGRPEHVQNARGYVTTNIYNARDLIATESALGYRATSSYDALGRQVAAQTPLGYRSTTIYRSKAQIPSRRRMSGANRDDAVGQVAAQQDALGYFTSFRSDLSGNRVTMVNALGCVSAYGGAGIGRRCKPLLFTALRTTIEWKTCLG